MYCTFGEGKLEQVEVNFISRSSIYKSTGHYPRVSICARFMVCTAVCMSSSRVYTTSLNKSMRRVAICGYPVLLASSLYFVVRHIMQKQGGQSKGGGEERGKKKPKKKARKSKEKKQ